MEPTRHETIGGHLIEEFYWNSRPVVYVDHHHSDLNFEQAIERFRKFEIKNTEKNKYNILDKN